MAIPLLKLLADLHSDGKRPVGPDFVPAIAALLNLAKAFPQSGGDFREAIRRLRQLQWMVQRVYTLDTDVGGSLRFGMGNDVRVIELITLAESAYYIAFRLKGVINSIGNREGVSALKAKKFNPPGVRDVRNHLLEHTKEPTYVFATGGRHGPQLKPLEKYRGKNKPFDRGLYINIIEFLEDLNDAIGSSSLGQ